MCVFSENKGGAQRAVLASACARCCASGARYPPANGGRPRFFGAAAGLRQPLRANSRLIELGARCTLRAIARSVQTCPRLNWIMVRSSQLKCLYVVRIATLYLSANVALQI